MRTASTNLGFVVTSLISGFWLASRKKTFAEALFFTWRLSGMPVTWSPDRLSATWLSPRCTLSFCVADSTLRMTTFSYAGLSPW